MSTNFLEKWLKKKKVKKEKKKPKLKKEEKFFLISLYPKGRSERNIFEQLKSKYPSTGDAVLKDRMRRWVIKMNTYQLLRVVPTEELGHVVSLTKAGVDYTHNTIEKLFKKDIESFVLIIQRLMNQRDSWTLRYYKDTAIKMINTYLPLYSLIFNPKSLELIVQELKDPFGLKLNDSERYEKFEDDIKTMESFGLIDIEYGENTMVLGASSTARKIFAKTLRNGAIHKIKDAEKKLKKTKKSSQKAIGKTILLHDKFVVVSVLISLIIAFVIIAVSFPLDPATNQISTDNHSGIYLLGTIPILVLVFYFIFSFLYYFLLTVQKKH